ncbi:MAG: hypothetical protein HC899_28570 [Leptolyngbyaceae cyanobacterium SM1_4_3]|nr:hypothetical protein [Leptolyngbyaceae cyanobacterium SM1_4_3]
MLTQTFDAIAQPLKLSMVSFAVIEQHRSCTRHAFNGAVHNVCVSGLNFTSQSSRKGYPVRLPFSYPAYCSGYEVFAETSAAGAPRSIPSVLRSSSISSQ